MHLCLSLGCPGEIEPKLGHLRGFFRFGLRNDFFRLFLVGGVAVVTELG